MEEGQGRWAKEGRVSMGARGTGEVLAGSGDGQRQGWVHGLQWGNGQELEGVVGAQGLWRKEGRARD